MSLAVAETVSIPRPNDNLEPLHPLYADTLNLIAHLKILDCNIWYTQILNVTIKIVKLF